MLAKRTCSEGREGKGRLTLQRGNERHEVKTIRASDGVLVDDQSGTSCKQTHVQVHSPDIGKDEGPCRPSLTDNFYPFDAGLGIVAA